MRVGRVVVVVVVGVGCSLLTWAAAQAASRCCLRPVDWSGNSFSTVSFRRMHTPAGGGAGGSGEVVGGGGRGWQVADRGREV